MFQKSVNLSHFSSYKIGGPASFFLAAKSADKIEKAVARTFSDNLPIFVLGGGTNLLISDEGFKGLVLKPGLLKIEADGTAVKAEAGASMEKLLDFLTSRGLSGLEWAGGLPGTLGGAIRGNAGAFGGEIKDVVHEVVSLAIESGKARVVRRTNQACRFGYRTSVFKESQGLEIILYAVLKTEKGDKKRIREMTEEKIAYRAARHPMEYPNIGSIFKNVDAEKITTRQRAEFQPVIKTDPFPVVPAAYLISEAGLKGVSSGGAMISPKHPNFIVNVLEARAKDVKNLIELVKSRVKEKFDITLEEEVIYID